MRAAILGFTILLFGLNAPAQQGGATGGGNTGGGATGGGNTGGGGAASRTTSPIPNDPGAQQRPIFLSGQVILSDGTLTDSQVKIERVCNGNVRVEGYADRKGHFSIELGRTFEVQDASTGSNLDPFSSTSSQDPFRAARAGLSGSGISERELWNCEIRAALSGYRSDTISLASRHYMDSPDIGTIVLRPFAKVDGLTLSATSALAPKDAKKAYEKALDALKKNNPDAAQDNLEKATTIYPKYAAAWLELGKILEQRDHPAEARRAYDQALTADERFLPPYERMSIMAFKESKWQEVADTTDKLLRLDPFTYPDAYYMNSIANLQLKHFDVAEKSAREAIRLDPAKKNMRSYYILGLAQASQSNFAESLASIKTFMGAAPEGTDLELVRKQMAQIEQAAQGRPSAPQPQP